MATLFHVICVYMFFLGGGVSSPSTPRPTSNRTPQTPITTQHNTIQSNNKQGVARLYRGLLPRLLRVPPGMAITWCVFIYI